MNLFSPASRRIDTQCAALLLVVGTCVCMQTFASGVWGARPIVSDEFVYLFQAKTLAAGHLTYPSPPLPEFFENAHLLVVPTFAAKYLPGHAAILAPFQALGVPWLAPCLLLGITTALLFIAARLAGLTRATAIAAACLLLGATEVFPFFGSYLSQSSSVTFTAALFVAILAVRRKPSPIRIAALSGCVAYLTFVRPFPGVAAGLTALFVLFRLRPRVPVRVLAWAVPPLLAGAVAVAITCAATTGSMFTTPWGLYARQYIPFDGPGIGDVREVAPERTLPSQLQPLYDDFLRNRRKHTFARLPAEAMSRAREVLTLSPSWWLIPFALIGLFYAPLAFTSVFALAYFLLQLTFHSGASNYYLEMYPWLALAIAAGGERAVREALKLKHPLAYAACAVLAVPMVWASGKMISGTATVLIHAPNRVWHFSPWEPAFAMLRQEHALVFIRFAPGMSRLAELSYNEPDLAHADVVRAIDKGPRNSELMAYFPDRPAYVYDLANDRLERIR